MAGSRVITCSVVSTSWAPALASRRAWTASAAARCATAARGWDVAEGAGDAPRAPGAKGDDVIGPEPLGAVVPAACSLHHPGGGLPLRLIPPASAPQAALAIAGHRHVDSAGEAGPDMPV